MVTASEDAVGFEGRVNGAVVAAPQIDGFAQLEAVAIDDAADPLVDIAFFQPVVDVETNAAGGGERYERAHRKTEILAALFAGAVEGVSHAANEFGH